MRALIAAAALVLAACGTTPRLPIDAQCNDMCRVPCTTDGDTGIRWQADPDEAEAWDALGGEVVPALVELANTCEARRRACDQCLRRLDAAGIIRY